MTNVVTIGQESEALIVNEETGGEAYYLKTEQHPDYPGGASGVTVGCGYDCGYSTAAEIGADWGPVLPAAMVEALQSVAGIHGSPARSHAAELRGVVTVSWAAAQAVFVGRDVPKWTATVQRDLPNTDLLPPDCLGVLVSVAFNRGASFDLAGDRYREMRAIKADMASKNFAGIPAQIRSMKRLWPAGTADHADLVNRREHEAALFERALAGHAAPAAAPEVTPASPSAATVAHDTAWVQASLNKLMGINLKVDGDAGRQTEAAIRMFQRLNRIGVDGIAGPQTMAAIEKDLAR